MCADIVKLKIHENAEPTISPEGYALGSHWHPLNVKMHLLELKDWLVKF